MGRLLFNNMSEEMKICTMVSDGGIIFLGVGSKATWLVYFKDIWKNVLPYRRFREIILYFSKGKAGTLEMYAKILLGWNGRQVVKLLN